jgi:enamine deaminase RidA (YjgF/YER057c/UK114 family)
MVEQRLREAGIELPAASVPAANYIPFMVVGRLLFVAGQIPVWNGERRYVGRVGTDFGIPEAREAAKICALNLLAQAKNAIGDLDRITRVVKLGGFVACTPEFDQHPQVINAASELMIAAFGDAGRHTRTSVGAPSLPFGVAVEIDGIFELGE